MTHEVQDGEDGADGRALRLIDHTAPDAPLAGWFASPPELHGGDPFETPWMEAGPDRLAVLHQGRHALSRPGAADPRVTMAVAADSTTGLVVFQERQCTPAETDDLLAKVVTQAQETVRDHPRP
ncbi:hypothetical protein [Streptomyces sp. NRRL S-340]|uniref:hypothetical protein n=1 Tax=Streptomyces sp. NRRL S-340 TaxID=1463901 RepID=UPI000562E084|nr:hypothetical protein [Streptomyces sp. NRRL S-340]